MSCKAWKISKTGAVGFDLHRTQEGRESEVIVAWERYLQTYSLATMDRPSCFRAVIRSTGEVFDPRIET